MIFVILLVKFDDHHSAPDMADAYVYLFNNFAWGREDLWDFGASWILGASETLPFHAREPLEPLRSRCALIVVALKPFRSHYALEMVALKLPQSHRKLELAMLPLQNHFEACVCLLWLLQNHKPPRSH